MNNRTIGNTAALGSVLTIVLLTLCTGRFPVTPANTHQLTLLAGAGGTIAAPSHATVNIGEDESIPIKATADAGYTFLKWTTVTECAAIAYKNASSTTVRLSSGNDTVQAVFIHGALGLSPVDMADLGRLEPGVSYHYYTGAWTALPDFSALDPDTSDSCGSFDIAALPHRSTNFGVVFNGYLDIPFNGAYSFYLKSSDGSALLLNDSILIHNEGVHSSPIEASATATLDVGKYLITVRYCNANSSPACTVSYACPSIGIEKRVIANGVLSRPYTGPMSKIIITKPVGGESYFLGDTLLAQWIYRHFDHMVFCEISTDDGKTYALLSLKAFAHTDTNGIFEWEIPKDDAMITNQARIRVRDYPPGGNLCVSNRFSIYASALR
jgi:hypothetical protein